MSFPRFRRLGSAARTSCFKGGGARPQGERAGFASRRTSVVVDATSSAAVFGIAAEAIGFMLVRNGRHGVGERRGRGEIRHVMMPWPVCCLVRGSAEDGSCKERDRQNECERH